MAERPVEPFDVARMVESFVDEQHRDAAKYSNREVLDDSGVYDLHALAARIYALGFNDGTVAEGWRANASRQRERAAAKRVPEPDDSEGPTS